ncbi:MAG: hypothetical protein QXJ69_02625 [Desulfurococcaceae archaeon]
METSLNKVVHRASQLDEMIVLQSISLLEKIRDLEVEVERSDMEDEVKKKIKTMLEKLREQILIDIMADGELSNVFKPS